MVDGEVPVVELKSGQKAYYVACNSDLGDWPRWAQWLVRLTFFATGYFPGSQSISIATTKEIAREMCKGKHCGWFIHTLVVNEPLPDEICQLEPTEFPNSPEQERYENYWPKLQAVRRSDLKRGLEGMGDELDALSKVLTPPDD